MRRRSLLAAIAVLVAVLAVGALPVRVAAATPVQQQEPDAPADDDTGGSADETDPGRDDDAPDDAPDENPEPAGGESIIPEPNSGRPPEDAGDRGGVLQTLVFVLIVVGVGGIAALVVRDARRSRARSR